MRITILFGGTNKERLVSVASAQALHLALPEADLWFWDIDDTVHEVRSEALLNHSRPFEEPFKPGDRGIGIERALDRAQAENRLLVLGLHGGRAENGELQAMCEMRGIPFTGSGSASSHLAFDKVAAKRFAAIAGVKAPSDVALEDAEAALAEYGKLIAKPARDGSSYGLIFVNAKQDLVAVRDAARTEDYLIEPFVSGVEATCGVLEQLDGSVTALPPVEIIPAEGDSVFYRQISRQVDAGDLPRPLCA
jgi:D-alanine-D-alanine ligase